MLTYMVHHYTKTTFSYRNNIYSFWGNGWLYKIQLKENLKEDRRNEMEVVTKILESNLVSAIIALIGVIISLKWSTGETTKEWNRH